ncbi:diguanylate cyclase (GGDEF) domain-containing protein [Shewanella psychrophila]|uniref:diguanylate cyclase n=1 Tax=Shewanella psychrophila TaxID=225848 RepID=A0A1S6HU76_9GAMM|nr:GGDEF domain-containing protein [Shewanella psychrophila]AQS38968.1 diguanylate cyclase (GGDEF) domain-containing protein [Shewanella psychrophila]
MNILLIKLSHSFRQILLFSVLVFAFPLPVESLELDELDHMLTEMEGKRTQNPQFIVDSLKEIDSISEEMSEEQKYRTILLQAHSLAMNGKVEEAIDFLVFHLKVIPSTQFLFYRTRMLGLLANAYSFNNQFSLSLQTLQELLPLLGDIDDIESEVSGYRLAIELFGEVKMKQEALNYANILYDKFDHIASPRHKCFVAFYYAESFSGVYETSSSRWSEIEVLYRNAFESCEVANEKMIMASAALGQAKILINRESFLKAKGLINNALALSSSIPYPLDIAEAYLLLAKIETKNDQPRLGVEWLKKALAIGLTTTDSQLLSKIYKPLAEISEQLGHSDQALKYLKLYQERYSEILGATQSKIIAFETTKLDYLEKERQIRYLNKDRELYTAKAALNESQRSNERMMNTLIVGSLVLLAIFAVVMTMQKRKYKQLAQHDALTGIFNRGTAQNIAENSYIKTASKRGMFSVIMFDLDYFKRINDNFGHGTGDWVLKKVAEVINKASRSDDIFARFGGEEFALFLPGTDEMKANVMAEEYRGLIQSIETRFSGHTFDITASFGVSTSSEDDLSLDPLLHRADIAMYHSKELGRNCVTLYKPEIELSRSGYQKSKMALR